MYAGVGLVNPKHAVNVGAALRAANCYNASFVVTTGRRYEPAVTDTSNASNSLPLFSCLTVDELRKFIPFNCVPVAVGLLAHGISLPRYQHPKRAFYIFGPEDSSLGSRVTDWCRDIIYIPTHGCMNLAACVNVVLYDRQCKSIIELNAINHYKEQRQ